LVISKLGGLTSLGILQGHWFILIFSGFLHFGMMHLLMNMLALSVLGRVLESGLGSGRFLIVYLMAILGGACCALLFDNVTPLRLTAGASGGVWGLSVAYILWVLWNRKYVPQQMYGSIIQNWLFSFFVNLSISFLPGISLTGHLGGGVIGGLAFILIYLYWHGTRTIKLSALLGLCVLPLICVLAVVYQSKHSEDWLRMRPLINLQQMLEPPDEARSLPRKNPSGISNIPC
jgi:membrane associated rhomboid family serine protease